MVTIKSLTRKNTAKELEKVAPAANRLYALAQKEKKSKRETWEQLLLKTLRDMQLILEDLKQERDERRKKISSATKDGLARAKKRGVRLGGARRKSNVDTKKVFALRKKGLTQQQIAFELNISQPLVSKILAKRSRGATEVVSRKSDARMSKKRSRA